MLNVSRTIVQPNDSRQTSWNAGLANSVRNRAPILAGRDSDWENTFSGLVRASWNPSPARESLRNRKLRTKNPAATAAAK